MTTPDDDFERRLRATLGQHADEAPRVDLADAALTRAGRIRARRRVGVGLTAAAVVALAVPVASTVLDDEAQRDETATNPVETTGGLPADVKPVSVALTGLGLGEAPGVPYIDGDQFVTPGATTTLAATSESPSDAVRLSDGVAVWSLRDETSGQEALSANGATTDLLPTGLAVTKPTVDSDTGEVAFAALGAPGEPDTVVVAGALNDDSVSASTGDVQVNAVMGVNDGVVVFNGAQGKEPVVGSIDLNESDPAVETPWSGLNAKTVSAIDPQFSQFAAFVGERKGPKFFPRPCITMFTIDGDEEWESCAWKPVEFSADGSLVLAIASDTEGFAARQMAVLDSATGSMLAEFKTPGSFGRATFDGDDVVVVTLSGDQSAIVRCDLQGECELATPTQTVDASDPDTLIAPYQLTAN